MRLVELITNTFTEKEINTISDWIGMGGAGEDVYELAKIGKRFPKFRQYNKTAYRVIGLDKDHIRLLLQNKTLKTYKVESWSATMSDLYDFYMSGYGMMADKDTYPIIFRYKPGPDEVVLNLAKLQLSKEFEENPYMDADAVMFNNEVVLNTKGLSIDNVYGIIDENTNKIHKSNITKLLTNILS